MFAAIFLRFNASQFNSGPGSFEDATDITGWCLVAIRERSVSGLED
jgi:hypothetical protein